MGAKQPSFERGLLYNVMFVYLHRSMRARCRFSRRGLRDVEDTSKPLVSLPLV